MNMPIIGVTASRDDRGTLSVGREYLDAVFGAGGLTADDSLYEGGEGA